MVSKSKDFQWDIRLGLALIVLVLVILNFASHYTLYRVRHSVEAGLIDDLQEAAVVVSNKFGLLGTVDLADSTLRQVEYEFGLSELIVVPLNYDRVMAIEQNGPLDSAILNLEKSLTPDMLKPLLMNEPVYYHDKSDVRSMILFPVGFAGSKYIIAAGKESPLLSSIEKAGTILIYAAILCLIIIAYASRKFARFVIYPFKRLKEKAEKSGRLGEPGNNEIEQVVTSYEKIIDELKSKEKELIRLNEIVTRRAEHLEVHNENILRSMKTALITLDTDGKTSTINPAAVKILGKCEVDLLNCDYRILFNQHDELKLLIDEFMKTDVQVLDERIDLVIPDGSKLIILVSLTPLTDGKGKRIGTSIALNDQSKFITLQEELELKQRLATLGEMSGGLAHQMKNSIAGIFGFARLISKKVKGDKNVAANIDNLMKETTEAELLINRFLDYARPLEIQHERLDIKKVLEDVVAINSEKYRNVRFSIELADVNFELHGDSLFLKQAVGNLVDNACKSFENRPGEVQIAVDVTGNFVTIRIIDNGPGIPEEYRDKIFAPFFSGSPSGSGLGLPLAKKIVTLHGGRLEFESNSSGTAFIVTLPVYSGTSVAVENSPQASIKS